MQKTKRRMDARAHCRGRFSGGVDLIARRRMLFCGVIYEPGDPFPWREVANYYRARLLWRARHVEIVGTGAASLIASKPKPKPKPKGKRKERANAADGV